MASETDIFETEGFSDEEKSLATLDRYFGYYILDENHEPHPATLEEYGVWDQEPGARILRQEDVIHPDGRTFHVSTVFLGFDHSLPRNPDRPLLWETMVFQRQTETTHLTEYVMVHDEHGDVVYVWEEWVDGEMHRTPKFDRQPVEVGELSYADRFCERYFTYEEALNGHQQTAQGILEGTLELYGDEDEEAD